MEVIVFKRQIERVNSQSMDGWGLHRDGMRPTGGRWLAQEIAENKHINYLELEAAKLGLQALYAKD